MVPDFDVATEIAQAPDKAADGACLVAVIEVAGPQVLIFDAVAEPEEAVAAHRTYWGRLSRILKV
jgi:hypothetical protein